MQPGASGPLADDPCRIEPHLGRCETGEPQLDAVMGNKLRTLNNWADALITAAAAENAAAVVSDNYKDVKTAADRFAKAGGAKLEVWKYAGAHREVLRCRAGEN